MSRRIVFPTGYEAVLDNWTGNTFKWALIEPSWIPDETTQVFMASITAHEFTEVGYARVTLTGAAKSIALPSIIGGPGLIKYTSDDPDFGVLSGSQTATSLVLFQFVTNDADSPMVASYPCYYLSDGATDALFSMSSGGTVLASTVCPDGF